MLLLSALGSERFFPIGGSACCFSLYNISLCFELRRWSPPSAWPEYWPNDRRCRHAEGQKVDVKTETNKKKFREENNVNGMNIGILFHVPSSLGRRAGFNPPSVETQACASSSKKRHFCDVCVVRKCRDFMCWACTRNRLRTYVERNERGQDVPLVPPAVGK